MVIYLKIMRTCVCIIIIYEHKFDVNIKKFFTSKMNSDVYNIIK
jgi:hypothetical protein